MSGYDLIVVGAGAAGMMAAGTAAENGARVRRGDLIAKAAEGLSSNIYASIDGTVTDIGVQGARIVSGV